MADSSQPPSSQPTVRLPSLSSMTYGMSPREEPLAHKQSPGNEVRDSGNWSLPSKHSSTVSSNPGGLQSILNHDDSSSPRYSIASTTPSSARYSGVIGSHGLSHLNQPYPNRDSLDGTFLDSRRSSVDSSRVSATMGQLQLNNPTSPYESANASRASLQSSLQHQRGIQHTGAPRLTGLKAHSPSSGIRPNPRGAPRIAPPIMGPRGGGAPDPTASAPTPGFAWAFPDNPDEMDEESPRSSRQGSIAASSINTLESGAFHGGHNHPLQPRNGTSITSIGDGLGSGNYSRTPELRISHKLAERKRRSEMKDLFENLNQILPNSPGSKSSKWEILTKAIDYIQSVQATMTRSQRESEHMREELQQSRSTLEEVHALKAELTAMYQQLRRVDPNGAHVYGPKTHALVHQESQNSSHPSQPPHTNGQQQAASAPSWGAQSGAMQGVEYGNSYDRR